MLPWPYAINSIEMNHGYIATSLKIVLLNGNWLKKKIENTIYLNLKNEYFPLESLITLWENTHF